MVRRKILAYKKPKGYNGDALSSSARTMVRLEIPTHKKPTDVMVSLSNHGAPGF